MATETRDFLQRVLFEEISARCVRVRLEQVLSDVFAWSQYPEPVARLLSEALLTVATLSSGIKFSGRISLQLQSAGPLSLLMADCTDSGGLRGVARLAEGAELSGDEQDLWRSLADKGVLTLTLDPPDGGERWQGIVPLEGDSMAEAVEAYFRRSEQLPTRIRLAVDNGVASALMIQKMPGETEDDDGWNRLEHLLATVSSEELLETTGDTLMNRLFHAESRRQFPARPLQFYCPCSRERVLEVLRGLGAAELEDMISQGEAVEVRCEFCNEAYDFDLLDLADLAGSDRDGGDLGEQSPDNRTIH